MPTDAMLDLERLTSGGTVCCRAQHPIEIIWMNNSVMSPVAHTLECLALAIQDALIDDL